jgi:hypothetical protein
MQMFIHYVMRRGTEWLKKREDKNGEVRKRDRKLVSGF